MRATEIDEDILDEWRPPVASHVLLITGKLAHTGLERMMQAIAPTEFTYEIRVLDINIAAWLDVEQVEKLIGDLEGVSLVMVPGMMMGDEEELAKYLGVPVVRGPKCYSELPTFLEAQGFEIDDSSIPRPHLIVLGDSIEDRDAAGFLAKQYEIELIDLAVLLAAEITSGSDYGAEIDTALKNGDPVRHNVMAELVRSRIALRAGRGWVLSGYPTTMRDVQWLDSMSVDPDAVVVIDTDPELAEVVSYYQGQRTYIDIDGDMSLKDIHETLVVRVEALMQQCVVPDSGAAKGKEAKLEKIAMTENANPSGIKLAARIEAFLDTHAKIAASYDPEFDDPEERFNGPDSAMFEAAAKALRAGQNPPHVRSTYSSGCYAPIADKGAEAEHNELLKLVNNSSFLDETILHK